MSLIKKINFKLKELIITMALNEILISFWAINISKDKHPDPDPDQGAR